NDAEVGVTNCTFSGNTAPNGGGGLSVKTGANVGVDNCILWENAPDQILVLNAGLIVTYSDVQGGWGGIGNFSEDPLFVQGQLGECYLSQIAAGQPEQSPCVDAGNPMTPLFEGTTRTDQFPDVDVVDLGFHYAATELFIRGDCNADDSFNIADAIFGLNFLFVPGGVVPSCEDSCDVNDDASVNIADVIYVLTTLFSDGPNPLPPFPDCGSDPTADALECESFAACP
ncbi:MAG: hypothetical protein V3T77_02925, partial [Planctomycetota bacterium]